MSTPTKEVGKPKLASGQILDDVMRGVDTWNGEPHGFLRGRIALVESAGPVVKVFVRLALTGLTVFPRPSSSKRGGYSWRDCLQYVKTMLYSPINGLPLKVDLDDAARRAEFARTLQPAGADTRTNGTLFAMEVSLRTVAQIKSHAQAMRDKRSKRGRGEGASSSDDDDDDDGPRRFLNVDFDGDGGGPPTFRDAKSDGSGDQPPGTRTATLENADPSMSGLDLAGDEHGQWYAVRNGRAGNTIVNNNYDEVMRQADGVKKPKGAGSDACCRRRGFGRRSEAVAFAGLEELEMARPKP